MDALVVGSVAWDTIVFLDDPPAPGHPRQARSVHESAGGCGANVTSVLHALGDLVGLQSVVGDDPIGATLRSELGSAATHVVTQPGPTPRAVMLNARSEQWIAFYPGPLDAWAKLEPALAPLGHFAAGPLPVYPSLMVQDRITFDPGQELKRHPWPVLRECIRRANVVFGNADEVGYMAARAGGGISALLALGPQLIVETHGAAGCALHGPDERADVPGAPAKAVDPTGAGDAHRAGFLHGMVRGWDWVACARLGNVLGALAVERIGALRGPLPREDVAQRHRDAYRRDPGA